MIPGEYKVVAGEIQMSAGRKTTGIIVVNMGDRPVQVGSHAHFFEVNRALRFPREQAFGMRLCIPSGTAVRFEPGEEKPVTLTEFGGERLAFGLNALTHGSAFGDIPETVRKRLREWEAGETNE